MFTTEMTPEEAAIMEMFNKPPSHITKMVRVSDEQMRYLQELPPEEREKFIKKNYGRRCR